MSDRISDNEYWKEIHSIADELVTKAKAGEFGTGESARETFGERVWEWIDGHSWVIYTSKSQEVVAISPNDGYSAENFGAESIVTDGAINWAALAFGAMYGDVMDYLDYLFRVDGFDVNDPNPESE